VCGCGGNKLIKKPVISFLDLDVYKTAYDSSLIINRELIPSLPEKEKFRLSDQLHRACMAICPLIAEGYAVKHQHRNWQKYLDDAIGEANEIIVHLSYCRDLYSDILDIDFVTRLIDTYDKIGKQLYNLGKSWKKPLTHNASA